jgi:hypothetical protein
MGIFEASTLSSKLAQLDIARELDILLKFYEVDEKGLMHIAISVAYRSS